MRVQHDYCCNMQLLGHDVMCVYNLEMTCKGQKKEKEEEKQKEMESRSRKEIIIRKVVAASPLLFHAAGRQHSII